MPPSTQSQKILVTGTSGYVGGRLVPRLLSQKYPVRVLSRQPTQLEGRTWRDQVEVIQGDVFKPDTLNSLFEGIATAYYMIPTQGFTTGTKDRNIIAARQFSHSAQRAGVQRLIYLGGLGDPCTSLSSHLRSRQQIGDVLRQSGIPVTEFRAAVIVGSGSTTFEMIRYLTERLPIIFLPTWGYTRIQPIAISNVIDYLVATLEKPQSIGEVIDIGGPEILTFSEMMQSYARVRGLTRLLIQVPFKMPRAAAYWTHLTTPLPHHIALRLINDLCNDVVLENDHAAKLFPDIHPIGYQQAVAIALERLDAGEVESSWSDSFYAGRNITQPTRFHNEEGMVFEQRQAEIRARPTEVFDVIARLGGERGWLFMNWAWRLRGILDRLTGGVGLQRGRRDPASLRVGDAVDFWRVEAIEPNRLIRLRAEMKVPGLAWLQFDLIPLTESKTRLQQIVFFAPKGLSVTLYWYVLYPIHKIIFSGMIQGIAERAEAQNRTLSNPGNR